MFHVVSVTFSDAIFLYISIAMTMNFVYLIFMLNDIKYLKEVVLRSKIFKISLHELSRLQTLQKFNFLFLTEMFYGAKHWISLERKLYFLETIVFNDVFFLSKTLSLGIWGENPLFLTNFINSNCKM